MELHFLTFGEVCPPDTVPVFIWIVLYYPYLQMEIQGDLTTVVLQANASSFGLQGHPYSSSTSISQHHTSRKERDNKLLGVGLDDLQRSFPTPIIL